MPISKFSKNFYRYFLTNTYLQLGFIKACPHSCLSSSLLDVHVLLLSDSVVTINNKNLDNHHFKHWFSNYDFNIPLIVIYNACSICFKFQESCLVRLFSLSCSYLKKQKQGYFPIKSYSFQKISQNFVITHIPCCRTVEKVVHFSVTYKLQVL